MDHKVYSVVSSYPLDCVVMMDEWRKTHGFEVKGCNGRKGRFRGLGFRGIGSFLKLS
jgi:hypothetical protein